MNDQTNNNETNTITQTSTDTIITNTPPIESTPTEISQNTTNTPPTEMPTNTDNTSQNLPSNNTKKPSIIPIVLIIVLVVGIGGYFAYTKLFSNKSNNTSTTTNNNNSSNTNTNKKDIYPGQKVYEIPLGISDKGVYKKLCNIKIGNDMVVYGDAINNTGDYKTIRGQMGEVYEKIDFSNYLSTIINGTSDNEDIAFIINPLKVDNIQTWEDLRNDYLKSNVEITEVETDKNPAFIVKNNEDAIFKVALIYKIDDEWILSINYKGNLTKSLSTKELAEKLYNLVTPI